MASPIGHGVMGAAVARRFGVKSRFGLICAALAASLPDSDIILGAMRHSDAWTLHRKGTHTLPFALTAGALAGFVGVVGAGRTDGGRDLVIDALAGAIIVGSHIPLDRVPIPRLPYGPFILRMSLANWILDAAVWGVVAWAIWPRPEPPEATSNFAPRA